METLEEDTDLNKTEQLSKKITIQSPVYCGRCYHSLCIPQCIQIGRCEEEEEEEEEEEDDSDTEESPLFREDPDDVEEQILEEIDDWIQQNRIRIWHASVEKEMVNDVTNYLFGEWLEDDYCEEHDLHEIRDWVKSVAKYYFRSEIDMPPRQGGDPNSLSTLRKLVIANKLRVIDSTPANQQRTEEWYDARYGLLTASNVWKALGTESQQNQLIVEKCVPFDKFKEDCARHGNLSSDNPMAWGQRYEPITAMIYELKNCTKLGEYGCIVHPDWRFLGASPDGINVDVESPLYGRMVEIKNIVNRDIDGVPLDAYWVQMQIQMEVCDLDECDFVETRIKEFAGREEFEASDNQWRGLILTFVPRIKILSDDTSSANSPSKPPSQENHSIPPLRDCPESSTIVIDKKPKYEYLLLNAKDSFEQWIKEKIDANPNYVLYSTSYWGLDQYSCVLVKRNRAWFSLAIPFIERMWKIIEIERVTGCEHRAPKKRYSGASKKTESETACLVTITREDYSPIT